MQGLLEVFIVGISDILRLRRSTISQFIRTRRKKFFISFHWRPFVVIGSIVDDQLLFLPIEECLFLDS